MLYSQQCIPTSHNSFASSSNKFIFWPNQQLSIKDQLEIGVRGFMLDLYTISGQIVLRHSMGDIPGINKPIDSVDIIFYDVFKEFTILLEQSINNESCETITIILESYVSNKEVYRTLNQAGLADTYLYKENPNLATLEAVCNKIIMFTSHTKDSVIGIHPPKLYKENHYKYYKGGDLLTSLAFEKCEERAEGRAKYNDPTVSIFCFNHFSPISALIERAVLIKPLLHLGEELVDKTLESVNIPYKFTTAPQDTIKAFNMLDSLTQHLDNCRSHGIKDFFPTIIAVDFVEKDSGVFLCCNNSRCLLGEENSSWLQEMHDDLFNLTDRVYSWFYPNSTAHTEL